jgi:hypothetical protein
MPPEPENTDMQPEVDKLQAEAGGLAKAFETIVEPSNQGGGHHDNS